MRQDHSNERWDYLGGLNNPLVPQRVSPCNISGLPKQCIRKAQTAFKNHLYQWGLTWTSYFSFVAKLFPSMHVFSSLCTPWQSGRICWCHVDILTKKQCLNESRWHSSRTPSFTVNGKAGLRAVWDGQGQSRQGDHWEFCFSILQWRSLFCWPKLASHEHIGTKEDLLLASSPIPWPC